MELKPEIMEDIELLVSFVMTMAPIGNSAITDNYKRAADRVEAWLTTFQPNHLDDKTLEH